MSVRIFITDNYARALTALEDYIYQSSDGGLKAVETFLDDHDRVLRFIEHNPQTPAVHPATGDQSWVFGDGRYRLFFRCVMASKADGTIYLTHIIDNRRANIEIYPENSLPTYFEEE